MTKGWEFRGQPYRYFVGASDENSARQYLAKHALDASKVQPTQIPDSIVNFLKIKEGTVRSMGTLNEGLL